MVLPLDRRPPVMQLYIGRAALRGDIARYAKLYNLLELRAEPGRLPRAARLKEWRAKVPPEFVFSVLLPRGLSTLELGSGWEQELATALKVADALDARWVVLSTPPTLMPSARSRQRVETFFTRLRESGRRLAWEPRGLWEPEQVLELAEKLDVTMVSDVLREEQLEAPVVYTRLRALGSKAELRLGNVDRVADRLSGAEEAYVVVEGEAGRRAVSELRDALGATVGDLDELEDFEDDDEGEGDDEGAEEDDDGAA